MTQNFLIQRKNCHLKKMSTHQSFLTPLIPGLVWHSLGFGIESNVYIIISNNEALIVDTGFGFDPPPLFGLNYEGTRKIFQKIVKKFPHAKICLTHAHIDHSGNLMATALENELEIIAHTIEASFLEQGNAHYINPFGGLTIKKIPITTKVEENDTIAVGELSFEVYHTPGHTEGSICLYEPNKGLFITGDTIFPNGSFGRTDLPGGSSEKLYHTILRLSEISHINALLAGHSPPIIGKEAKKHVLMAKKAVEMYFGNFM